MRARVYPFSTLYQVSSKHTCLIDGNWEPVHICSDADAAGPPGWTLFEWLTDWWRLAHICSMTTTIPAFVSPILRSFLIDIVLCVQKKTCMAVDFFFDDDTRLVREEIVCFSCAVVGFARHGSIIMTVMILIFPLAEREMAYLCWWVLLGLGMFIFFVHGKENIKSVSQ